MLPSLASRNTFDRIILAQALSEGMALLAKDNAFGDYDVLLI